MANRLSQDGRILSHGRGGAGNLAKDDPTVSIPKADDLLTPTLKSNIYTTGRGGTGNMAQNDPQHPELARAAQDVDAPETQSEPTGPVHYGRGGAANIINKDAKRGSSDVKRNSADGRREEGAEDGGILAKGIEFLKKLGKK